uniref:Uncharacterized protein n=1 Tax=Anguilla anguilla TaxID=7936 RepID=A0A0E9UL80_ANGAN
MPLHSSTPLLRAVLDIYRYRSEGRKICFRNDQNRN